MRPEARNLDQLIIWLTQTFATVLSSGKNTNTDSMRACMKFQKFSFYCRTEDLHTSADGAGQYRNCGSRNARRCMKSFITYDQDLTTILRQSDPNYEFDSLLPVLVENA